MLYAQVYAATFLSDYPSDNSGLERVALVEKSGCLRRGAEREGWLSGRGGGEVVRYVVVVNSRVVRRKYSSLSDRQAVLLADTQELVSGE